MDLAGLPVVLDEPSVVSWLQDLVLIPSDVRMIYPSTEFAIGHGHRSGVYQEQRLIVEGELWIQNPALSVHFPNYGNGSIHKSFYRRRRLRPNGRPNAKARRLRGSALVAGDHCTVLTGRTAKALLEGVSEVRHVVEAVAEGDFRDRAAEPLGVAEQCGAALEAPSQDIGGKGLSTSGEQRPQTTRR
jgi:hypothetical protein